MADNDEVMNEIEAEIRKAKGEVDDFEIEIVDDPVQEKREEAKDVAEEQGDDYGPKVQKRIQKLVTQRRRKTHSSRNAWSDWSRDLSSLLKRTSISVTPKPSRLYILLWRRATLKRR